LKDCPCGDVIIPIGDYNQTMQPFYGVAYTQSYDPLERLRYGFARKSDGTGDMRAAIGNGNYWPKAWPTKKMICLSLPFSMSCPSRGIIFQVPAVRPLATSNKKARARSPTKYGNTLVNSITVPELSFLK